MLHKVRGESDERKFRTNRSIGRFGTNEKRRIRSTLRPHATPDIECVTQDEEEVYMKQFGEVFGKLATDKNAKSVVRDDFALEIADMDE